NHMEKINFSKSMNAPKEKVWKTLWEDETYRKWTSVFSPTSYADTDWKEGSKVLFLDGAGSGMVSMIEVNRPNEFMSFKHLGEVHNGVEDTESDKVKAWAGALENYTLKEVDGQTELLVEIDISEEHKDMFIQMFPKALEQVKVLSESN
ncbi:MAG TPA: SRPBCC domain-containing protein, partial [Segetibacter sp.]